MTTQKTIDALQKSIKRKEDFELAESLSQVTSELESEEQLRATVDEAKDKQLTLFDLAPWPNHMRALPNDYARSALFTVRNKRQPREALQQKEIFHLNNDVTITYTGIELRSDDDELVWQQVLEYAKRKPLGSPIVFTFYEICGDLGWSINGRYYKKAEECLTRLQASAIQFFSPRVGRLQSLSLIHKFRVVDRGKKTSRCEVFIDEQMIMLFAGDHYTRFEWETYRSLSPIARRLCDYFSSHKKPFPLKLEKFQLMCGSDTKRKAKWREQVLIACTELESAKLVGRAWVAGDSIYCQRQPSSKIASQGHFIDI